MIREAKNKLSVVFNGDTKWILTLMITVIVAAIAYGKQLESINALTREVNKKADIAIMEKNVKILDTKISSLTTDVGDMKKDIDIIRSDIKILLQKTKR